LVFQDFNLFRQFLKLFSIFTKCSNQLTNAVLMDYFKHIKDNNKCKKRKGNNFYTDSI